MRRRPSTLLAIATICACQSPDHSAASSASSLAFPGSAAWSVDSAPFLTLGDASNDTTKLFSVVIGATRLPDGKIIVADRQKEFTLIVYDDKGNRLHGTGRPGKGPGEFSYPAYFWRCGDSLVLYDISGYRQSVFALDGTFVRNFHFGAGAQAPGSQTPYSSVCNVAGKFAHYGWDLTHPKLKENEVLAVRSKAPFWLSGMDSVVLATLDSFPGSERAVHDGGSSPRMLGKQTSIAMTSDRLYVGTAERPEVFAISLVDYSVDTIAVPVSPGAVTPADIESLKAIELATTPADRRASVERNFATHPFPDSLPPYAELITDSAELLWVQDYPRAGSERVKWTIVSRSGKLIATVLLPNYFQVLEIGSDYILGKYLHPIESVPQVRLYRLHRGATG